MPGDLARVAKQWAAVFPLEASLANHAVRQSPLARAARTLSASGILIQKAHERKIPSSPRSVSPRRFVLGLSV
jgi:hypothetical protein